MIFDGKDIDFVTYFEQTFVNFTDMNENALFAIGLMSGTSLDGIDLVYVKFLEKDLSSFDILHAETIPYHAAWKQELQNAIRFSSKELRVLDHSYGKHL